MEQAQRTVYWYQGEQKQSQFITYDLHVQLFNNQNTPEAR